MGSHEIVLFGGKNRKEMRCVSCTRHILQVAEDMQ
jgi:hypothetical protein